MDEDKFKENFYPLAMVHFKSERNVEIAGLAYYDMVKKYDSETFKNVMLVFTDQYDGKFPPPGAVASLCKSKSYIPKRPENMGWTKDRHLCFGDHKCGGQFFHFHNYLGECKYECDKCGDPFTNFQPKEKSIKIIKANFEKIGV